jgi:hypothetical protein
MRALLVLRRPDVARIALGVAKSPRAIGIASLEKHLDGSCQLAPCCLPLVYCVIHSHSLSELSCKRAARTVQSRDCFSMAYGIVIMLPKFDIIKK